MRLGYTFLNVEGKHMYYNNDLPQRADSFFYESIQKKDTSLVNRLLEPLLYERSQIFANKFLRPFASSDIDSVKFLP